MKVLVIGANGQIGKQVIELLKASEHHTPIAMVRKEEQVQQFHQLGIQAVLADLEESVTELKNVMKDAGAVVFTAGSGGKTGPDKTLTIDLDGAVKSVEAAELAKVDRFVIVSAIQAHNRENWHPPIKPYFVAKHYADRAVMQSNLKYTIIRPGKLTNEPGTGKVTIASDLERHTISRADVAKVIVEVLEAKNTYFKGFDVISGQNTIENAVKTI